MKKASNIGGDKLDKTGGIIQGNLNIDGVLKENGNKVITDNKYYKGSCNDITDTCVVYVSGGTDCPEELNGVNYGFLFTKYITDNYMTQTFEDVNINRSWKRTKTNGKWSNWQKQALITDKTWFESPLTKDNMYYYDGRISLARLIILYVSCNANNYRGNLIIPIGDIGWYIYEYNNIAGFVMIQGDSITVSNYSDSAFKVFGFSLIM